ncbi:putative 3-hydroxyisobutyrate dehydrogenase mitochondrial precursor [Meira miltonrushii]|uniref:3-hydroxyisobutyrate dehydrogenase n=1 Tax=Meira miltonrushii TaxID=1280837 RepID=A0A316VI84_9BASI|nr:putative 3-hydroxyisobutyrate dehydrogenase mitochondrial precursor [Meira miltonrushii]PWN37210.1 putative 3-hydroxyisobutyrate dehydrogenase mitochondrial precursor [Meira miltonrushii]
MLVTPRLMMQSAGRNRAKTIGFIGLGAMGREMATNLLSKTFQASNDAELTFVVHDTVDQSTTRFLTASTSLFPGRHILPASSPAGVASLASTVITMVPSSPQVKEVYMSESGILEGLKSLGNPSDPSNSTLCIDCTTLDPLVAVQVADQIKRAVTSDVGAFDMVDAPVSGGTVGARAGTLSFMVGSDLHQSFTQAEHTLLKMGSRAIHCGKNGNGLIAKIANNLLLGISMLATSEAMLLGTVHGLSPQILAHIINTSTGKCWSSEVNNPCPGALHGTDKSPPAERDYEGGFAAKLQAKDLGLALSAAQQKGVPTPLGMLATNIYKALGENPDFMNRDFSVAFKALSSAVGKIPQTEDSPEL